jgi:microsomal dipeptidase-like Zn-dependent dipeptidase
MSDIWGYADLHTHPAAHLAFGGVVGQRQLFFGLPTGPLQQALPCCSAAHDVLPSGTMIPRIVDHGKSGKDGWPTFRGWPTSKTVLHQQMHLDSIARAHQNGLRLMVASAVNNEYLGWLYHGDHVDVSDDTAIQRQLEFIRAMAGSTSWMQVVTTAADARAAISAGKLAVVLGIEVDSLAGPTARRAQDFNAADVEARLDRWLAQGVRLLNVVHLADNVFSGCAIYDDRFNCSSHSLYVRHHVAPAEFWKVDKAPDIAGVQFLLGQAPDNKLLIGLYPTAYPDYLAERTDGHANARGLSDGGNVLLQLMMARGMMIDIDHMSQRSVNTATDLALQHGYPLVSSHTGLRALAVPRAKNQPWVAGAAHEGHKTDAQFLRLPQDSVVGIISHLGPVKTASSDSSASWAVAYKHAVEVLKLNAVCVGTDFNGLGAQPGPRHGNLSYDEDVIPGMSKVSKSVLGRQFDINTDGLAHYGMLPDFFLDVWLQYKTDGLVPLFRGAEQFVRAWERAESLAPGVAVKP